MIEQPPETNVDNPQPGTFFKYCGDTDEVIKGMFEHSQIRFTQPAALNDPFEFNPVIQFREREGKYVRYVFDGILFPSYQHWVQQQLIECQYNDFGILSLTKESSSFDMWNRYADGHRGFLLELKATFNKEACMLGKNGEVHEVRKVDYPDEYAFSVDEFVDEHGCITRHAFNDRLFFSKDSRWRDEKEWRMIRPMTECLTWTPASDKAHRDTRIHLFKFSINCVQSVTFGAAMSPHKKRTISDRCTGTGIQLLQAMIVRGGQGIVTRHSIEGVDDLFDLPDVPIMGGPLTKDELSAAPVQLRALSDLPYYARHEDWAKDYYEKARRNRTNS